MKKALLITLCGFQFIAASAAINLPLSTPTCQNAATSNFKITIPLGGNAYSSLHLDSKSTITKKGIENWTNPEEYFTVYFKIDKPGTFQINTLNTTVAEKAELSFEINNQKIKVKFNPNESNSTQKVGSFKIDQPGYVALKIKGLTKKGDTFPAIESLEVTSADFDGTPNYVPNNEGNFFHWGRRGPSVHLNYPILASTNAEYFYNEVTVPKGEDIIGSYFMANGFGEGYFGMQVNSENERRVLFSVWSPFHTNNPKDIPEEQQIKLLKKGANVHAGEFGNEGSGGQSYMKYNWIAGNTYKFLLKGTPNSDNSTSYTAYFWAPELNEWQLIASFKRPQTSTYLKRLHSFLENFNPSQGDLRRKVLFNNQWICDEKGNWIELNKAGFTMDNTGAKGYRTDYKGGEINGGFYLENCGFFNESTPVRSLFERPKSNHQPVIDFNKLP